MVMRRQVQVLRRERHDGVQIRQHQRFKLLGTTIALKKHQRKSHCACPRAKLNNALLCQQMRLLLEIKDECSCLPEYCKVQTDVAGTIQNIIIIIIGWINKHCEMGREMRCNH